MRNLLGESDTAIVEMVLVEKTVVLPGEGRSYSYDMPPIHDDLVQLRTEMQSEEHNFRCKMKEIVDEFMTKLKSLTQTFSTNAYRQPEVYRTINNSKVFLAKSANFFSIASFPVRGHSALLEIHDITSGKTSQVQVTAKEDFFQVFSSFDGVYVRRNETEVTRVTSCGNRETLSVETRCFEENVLTFVNEGGRTVCCTMLEMCEILQDQLQLSLNEATTLTFNVTISNSQLFFCLLDKENSIICGHITYKSKNVKSKSLRPFQSAKVDLATIVKASDGLVAVAFCSDSCSFEWVKLDEDLNVTGPIKAKNFDVKADINQIMFINSDCYLNVSTETILKYSSFFECT